MKERKLDGCSGLCREVVREVPPLAGAAAAASSWWLRRRRPHLAATEIDVAALTLDWSDCSYGRGSPPHNDALLIISQAC